MAYQDKDPRWLGVVANFYLFLGEVPGPIKLVVVDLSVAAAVVALGLPEVVQVGGVAIAGFGNVAYVFMKLRSRGAGN